MLKRVIKLIISIFYLGLITSKRNVLSLFNIPFKHCVILYYHSIKQNDKDRFIKQLNYIERYFKVIKADGNDQLEPNKRYIIITFDDGYQNLLHNAIPELKKRNFHSTIFIQTAYIGLKPGWDVRDDWKDNDELVMTEEHIKNTYKQNTSIGSHTKTHARITSLTDDKILDEMVESKATLERILESEVTLFSFPYGSFDKRSINIAKEAGYKRIFTTEPTIETDLTSFVLGRITVNPADWMIEFMVKLAGGYSWFKNNQKIN